MAIKLKNTGDYAANGVKLLVYGAAGVGKTTLIKTLDKPIVLSVESGLLSIRDAKLPYIEIGNLQDLREAYEWLTSSSEAEGFNSVAIDSLSEIGELVLMEELSRTVGGKKVDGRQAYGELNTLVSGMIRAFRDIPGKNIYMSAKLEKSQDELGRMLYGPNMPGKSLTQSLPYFFDEVLAMRVEKSPAGETYRALMCASDGLWEAKDRSGKLGPWERPDLSEIISKIEGKA